MLHVALLIGNNNSAEILLQYLAKNDWSNSTKFKDVFPKLLELRSFKGYMEGLIIQTQNMEEKTVLRVSEKYSSNVVKMAPSKGKYVDDYFF